MLTSLVYPLIAATWISDSGRSAWPLNQPSALTSATNRTHQSFSATSPNFLILHGLIPYRPTRRQSPRNNRNLANWFRFRSCRP